MTRLERFERRMAVYARGPLPPGRNDHDHGDDLRFANEQSLRPWREVAAEFNRRNGGRLSSVRAQQIATRAAWKLRKLLEGMARERAEGL
jgi:hypothetical protein